MRRLWLAFPVVVVVVVLWGSGRWAASAPGATGTLRVATFNIHKGTDLRGRYNLERTIDAIQRLDADLVGLQEVMRNHAGFNCDDQPALIAAGLRRRTGRPWTHVYERAWINTSRACLEGGQGDEVETEGLVFLTPHRIVDSSSVRLSRGRVGLAVRIATMPDLPVVVTHLTDRRQNRPARVAELEVLLPWAAALGAGVLIGDFNAAPGSSELEPVLARYRDAWAEAAALGRTGGVASGSTRPGRVFRIDYVFYAPEAGLALDSVDVVDTATPPDAGGVSDHHPVVARFRRHSATR